MMVGTAENVTPPLPRRAYDQILDGLQKQGVTLSTECRQKEAIVK